MKSPVLNRRQVAAAIALAPVATSFPIRAQPVLPKNITLLCPKTLAAPMTSWPVRWLPDCPP